MRLRSPRLHQLAVAVALGALAICLLGCTQSRATTMTTTPAAVATNVIGGSANPVIGDPIDTVDVWIRENAIMLWKPSVPQAGIIQFNVENRGQEPHDFTIVRWSNAATIPQRSGRALLQATEMKGRSPVLSPDETATILADLSEGGTFVVLSGEGTDYGDGLATTILVGRDAGRPVPLPPPDPANDSEVRAYLTDGAIFVSRTDVDAGEVAIRIQNLGPSEHDLLVIQWRGDAASLPVDDRSGEVLLDSLTIVDRVPVLAVGKEAVLDVEMQEDFGYALISSLPGDYAAGMAARLFAE